MNKAAALWTRYLVVLIILFSCFTGYFVVTQVIGYASEENATAINISGRQRMLSQRIALYSNKYMAHKYAMQNTYEPKERLLTARNLFETSHDALLNGNADLGLTGQAGKIANDIYFEGPDYLDRYVQEYLGLIDNMIDPTLSNDELQSILNRINLMSRDHMLTSLDKVVQAIENHQAEKIRNFYFWERVAFIIFFFIFLLEMTLITVSRRYYTDNNA